jgi:C4-dicarboxylate transporter DctQ subunit
MTKLIKFINAIEEWALVFILLGLAFLSFVQVLCRYFLGFSFSWMDEVSRYLGVFVAFLGAALGVKYGTHFSMDLVYEKVSSDGFRHGLKVFINVISGIIMFVVAWYGWEQTMKLRQFGVVTPVLQLPKYWVYLPIPVFSVITGARFFILARTHLLKLIRGESFKQNSEASC